MSETESENKTKIETIFCGLGLGLDKHGHESLFPKKFGGEGKNRGEQLHYNERKIRTQKEPFKRFKETFLISTPQFPPKKSAEQGMLSR